MINVDDCDIFGIKLREGALGKFSQNYNIINTLASLTDLLKLFGTAKSAEPLRCENPNTCIHKYSYIFSLTGKRLIGWKRGFSLNNSHAPSAILKTKSFPLKIKHF